MYDFFGEQWLVQTQDLDSKKQLLDFYPSVPIARFFSAGFAVQETFFRDNPVPTRTPLPSKSHGSSAVSIEAYRDRASY